ncbi:tubulin polyglutamylase TTLL7-like [Saccoglossus kowalevskii]|uniref:Tubulin polyglutamylase TTLL7-like n=1 Tax=Saccoglossus kowalevskii TaxID=10224 RepID=A0ABM0MQL2_SACKO|nr:PREDICTED: tubulin polyglutamylase TTLL7-like [Saccoglossus kowalevskii]
MHMARMPSASSLPVYKMSVTSSASISSLSSYDKGEQSAKISGSRSATVMENGLDDDDERQTRTSSSSSNQRQKKTKRKKLPIMINLSGTKYEIVRTVSEQFGIITSKEDDQNSFLYWSDSFVSSERIVDLKPYQRINHFPGMGEICRKDCLARNITKIGKAHPEEYNFSPRTWILPSEYNTFQCYVRDLKKKKKHKTFICKPANGAMGNGISIFRNGEKIPQHDHMIIQEYLDKPFLIDGYKFDLRVYVLVTSCDPLRIFLYNDGLVRLSTEKYCHPTESNVDQLFMHLTNYSVNKKSDNFEKTDDVDSGSKRSIKFLNDFLRKNDFDVAALWKSIADVIIKTMVVAEPHVLHAYRMCRPGQPPGSDSVCFEILGFDILLDRKLKPWLLEINRSPSFGTDQKIDQEIKGGLLEDTLRLLNIKPSDRRRGLAAQKLESQKRLLRPTRRSETELTDLDKKRVIVEKRRDELKERLAQVRRENAREEYENRNMGRFRRVFPPTDKFTIERYTGLLADAFQLFLSGRAASLQKEVTRAFRQLREDEILDMLQQCELDGTDYRDGKLVPRGPKPLSSMPSAADSMNNEMSELTPPESPVDDLRNGRTPSRSHGAMSRHTRPLSAQRPSTRPYSGPRSRSLTRPLSSTNHITSVGSLNPVVDEAFITAAVKEREEEMTKRTLIALSDMRIKFPGKTDEEAELILQQLQDNWKFHKPRIASYWLVKLDSIKRRKVVDIVRSNVRAVLQRTWRSSDVDGLRLYRIFNRVFNRLLWSHGQGLWNCFSTSGNSWETIFSKSTDVISSSEMSCCRRIVQLCRDCLLIVYQFASEAKNSAVTQSDGPSPSRAMSIRPNRPSSLSSSTYSSLSHQTTMSPVSQRMSRLYNNHRSVLDA